jgi:hypothetical protein
MGEICIFVGYNPIMKSLLLITSFFFLFQSSAQVIGNYNILILESNYNYSVNAQNEFIAMGHTATVIDASLLTSSFNYSPYDVVVFGYNSALPADLAHLLNENTNCNLGIVIMRGDATVDDLDMGASGYWNGGNFQVDDNTHWITSPFATGALPLSFSYKSAITNPSANTTTLGTTGGLASLLVHNTYKRVVMPYYGHDSGMPWSADAQTLTNRVIAWAASSCCTETTSSMAVSNCVNYTTPSGNVVTNSGIIEDTIPNAAGCDSIITIDVTILPTATGTDTRTECDEFTWIDGNTYTANNNTANFTIVGGASSGCDSIVTLDLSINTSSSSTITETGLDVYTAPSGATYTASGTYSDTIPNAAGCDSVITIDLTMEFTGIDEVDLSTVNVYPNPTSELITVQISTDLLGSSVEILDQAGRVVFVGDAFAIETTFNLGKLEKGLYYLKIGDARSTKFVKL